MNWSTFISLVAAIGVGTILSAFVGLLVAISNHRQSWINALRDDLSEFFKQIEVLAYVVRDYLRDSEKFDEKRRETRVAVLFIFERIRLRLNRKEDWPAPGSEDTKLGVLMEREVRHGATEVYAGVQA